MGANAVLGLKELSQELLALAKEFDDSGVIVEKALFAAANVVLDDAKARVPVKTGRLRDSGYATTVRFNNYVPDPKRIKKIRPRPGTAVVAFSSKKAHLLEYGTGPHVIPKKGKRKNQKVLKIGDGFAKTVYHPGSRAFPFLRPALDENKDEVIRVMEDEIQKGINALISS